MPRPDDLRLDPLRPPLLDPADARAGVQRALRDWLALQRVLALDPVRAAELLTRTRRPDLALREIGETPPRAGVLEADAATLRRIGARALPLLSPAYPPRLAQLSDPAPLLLVRGDAGALRAPAVAVVGARAATAYGLRVARALGRDLARAGLVVVSGLARGIDAAAHEGALEAGGRSVAVLACGLERIYPPENRGLAERIAERGAVASEQPLGTPPRRPYFPLRNRLLTGMALALVVVEARERSGSLVSAAHAARQDLDVFGVPGPVDAPASAGPNRLIQDGAYLARHAGDVLDLLAHRGHVFSPPSPDAAAAEGDASPLLRALRFAPATRDELGRRLGCSPEDLALELLQLELDGIVGEDRDGRLRILSG